MKLTDKLIVDTVNATRNELAPLLEKLDILRVSKHNKGYLRYREDPVGNFVDSEILRYRHTVRYIYEHMSPGSSVLDIGFFIPVVPVALAKLGYSVSCIEKFDFYDGALDDLVSHVTKTYGTEVIDLDIEGDDLGLFAGRFDTVLLLAVLEHLNGTPHPLLKKVKQVVKPGGSIIVEVPNVALFGRRLSFLLKGNPPFPPFEDYFWSEYPFSGHNREYSMADLEYTFSQVGIDMIQLMAFQNSVSRPKGVKSRIIWMLESYGPFSWRPDLWAVGRWPREGTGSHLPKGSRD